MSVYSFEKKLSRILRRLDQTYNDVDQLRRDRMHIQMPMPREPAPLPVVSPAWMLDLSYQSDGSVWVRVNEQHEFGLPPKLGLLLELLAADNGRCEKGIVEWKPAAALQAELTQGNTHAFNQLLSRLREALEANHLHTGLIQYHRGKRAYRFALRPA